MSKMNNVSSSSPPAKKTTQKLSSPLSKKPAHKLASGFFSSSGSQTGFVMVPIRVDLVVEVCRWQSRQAIRTHRSNHLPPVAKTVAVTKPSTPVVTKEWKVKTSVPEKVAENATITKTDKKSANAEKRKARNKARRLAWRSRRALKQTSAVEQTVSPVPVSVPPVSAIAEVKSSSPKVSPSVSKSACLVRPRKQPVPSWDKFRQLDNDDACSESSQQTTQTDDDPPAFGGSEDPLVRKLRDEAARTNAYLESVQAGLDLESARAQHSYLERARDLMGHGC